MTNKPKIVVILGPTASGKTSLGAKMAYIFNGEIVSADSRQVYKGMDIGTGKDLKEYIVKSKKLKVKSIKIPYHLIDVVSPKSEFNLAKYQKLAYRAIDDIIKKKKVPIIVGGSGLYLQSIVDGYELSKVKPDLRARKELEALDTEVLYEKLVVNNSDFARKLNNSDKNNKRRLIRYLELTMTHESLDSKEKKATPKFDALVLGLTKPRDELRSSVKKRLIKRLEKESMVEEVERLHREGVSWKKLESFGLEYKYISLYLQSKLTYTEMTDILEKNINNFTKKQLTWFRRWEKGGTDIHWLKNIKEAHTLIYKFIK